MSNQILKKWKNKTSNNKTEYGGTNHPGIFWSHSVVEDNSVLVQLLIFPALVVASCKNIFVFFEIFFQREFKHACMLSLASYSAPSIIRTSIIWIRNWTKKGRVTYKSGRVPAAA